MSHQHRLLRSLVERALRGSELLPLPDRADLHEAAAIALRRIDPPAADLAFHAAGLLRQAENRQLEFAALLRPVDSRTVPTHRNAALLPLEKLGAQPELTSGPNSR